MVTIHFFYYQKKEEILVKQIKMTKQIGIYMKMQYIKRSKFFITLSPPIKGTRVEEAMTLVPSATKQCKNPTRIPSAAIFKRKPKKKCVLL